MHFADLLERYPALAEYTRQIPPGLRSGYVVRELAPQHIIHQKDAVLEAVGILCEGTLKVTNEFASGNAFMIEYNTPIDIIGDVTVLAARRQVSVTIETVTPCTVLQFSRADFEGWLAQDPHLLRLMAGKVAGKLYQSSYRRGTELFYSSPRLMLEFLSRYLDDNPPQPAYPARVPDTRPQLGEKLGMSQKTVDRTVRRLKELQLIGTEKGKITVTATQAEQIRSRLAEWID